MLRNLLSMASGLRSRRTARLLAVLMPVFLGGGLVVAAQPAIADVSSVTACPDGTNPCTASTSGVAGATNQTYVIRFYTANWIGHSGPGSITISSGNGPQFPTGAGLYVVHDEGGPDCYANDFNYGVVINGGSSVTLDTTYACISPDSFVDVIVSGVTNPATPGTNYYAQVSTSADPTTQTSSFYSITSGTAPGAPSIISATRGNGRVDLIWNSPSDSGTSPVSDYIVNTYAAGSNTPVATDTGSAGTGFTVYGLSNGTSYTFTVQAVNASGTGPESAKSTAVVPASTPYAPTGLTARPISTSKIRLHWTDSFNGGLPLSQQVLTEYLYRPPTQFTPPSYTFVRTMTLAPGARTWTVPRLSKLKKYAFTVAAVNAVGSSAPSLYSNAVRG